MRDGYEGRNGRLPKAGLVIYSNLQVFFVQGRSSPLSQKGIIHYFAIIQRIQGNSVLGFWLENYYGKTISKLYISLAVQVTSV